MISITYYGHSSFLLEVSGKKLLFDPFITPNSLAKDISLQDIFADYILVSHGHEDHVADVISIANRCQSTLVSNFEITQWFHKKGVEKYHPMNIGGSWSFDFGKVHMVSAVHSSSMPDGSYGGSAAGFVLEFDHKTIYFAGDTALTLDMKILAQKFSIDLAFLPMGDNFTMGIEDAALASEWIACKNIIGMHYDTFGYIVLDQEKATSFFEKKAVHLQLLSIGSTIQF